LKGRLKKKFVKNQVEDNLSVPTNSVVTLKEEDCEMDAHQTIDKD
jgi:hypothetical protein